MLYKGALRSLASVQHLLQVILATPPRKIFDTPTRLFTDRSPGTESDPRYFGNPAFIPGYIPHIFAYYLISYTLHSLVDLVYRRPILYIHTALSFHSPLFHSNITGSRYPLNLLITTSEYFQFQSTTPGNAYTSHVPQSPA